MTTPTIPSCFVTFFNNPYSPLGIINYTSLIILYSVAISRSVKQLTFIVVAGGWGSWNSWTSCSVTCGGGGQRTRQRACDNPSPSNGGADCSGSSSEQESCNSSTACPGKYKN